MRRDISDELKLTSSSTLLYPRADLLHDHIEYKSKLDGQGGICSRNASKASGMYDSDNFSMRGEGHRAQFSKHLKGLAAPKI